jgi:hypothetical protein
VEYDGRKKMTSPFGIEVHLPDVTPPKPHPGFETYIVQASPSIGVFWVKAITPIIENDAYGNGVRQLKDELHAQLSKRYGPGKSTDQLMMGSIWDEPRDWIQSLNANERTCFVLWERLGSGQLPDDIENIFLGVTGNGIGAQILADLGIHDMILLTNAHRNIVALDGYGINVVGERLFPEGD